MARWLLTFATAAAIMSASVGAAASVPASFSWNAPLSCPGRDAILERLREAGDDPENPNPVDVEVVIEEEGEDAFHARLILVANHVWEERSFDASTCDAIADAIIVVVRVASRSGPAPLQEPTSQGPARAAAARPPPLPPPPPAPPSRPRAGFGSPRQLVVLTSVEGSFGVSNDTSAPWSVPWLFVAPSVDLFVGHRVSVGAAFIYEQTPNLFGPASGPILSSASGGAGSPSATGSNGTTLPGSNGTTFYSRLPGSGATGVGASARVGYDLPLGELVSLWPALSLSYEHFSTLGLSGDAVLMGVFAPVLFHAGHVVFGLGPDAGLGLWLGSEVPSGFQYGVRIMVGAWGNLGSEGP
jgi:hypothetical protein